MRALLLLACLLELPIGGLLAQSISRHDLGNPDIEWWSKNAIGSDTTASAVILYEYGNCVVEPFGAKLVLIRRIRILNKSSFDKWGNISIVQAGARLTDFTCFVYNLDGDKIIKTSVAQKSIVKRNIAEGVKQTALVAPNIREGSIIEYSYALRLNTPKILDWSFQHSIPVKKSEYDVFFPGGSERGVMATINGVYDASISADGKGNHKYIMTDLPPFVPEPFMNSERVNLSSIEFFPFYKGGVYEDRYIKNIPALFTRGTTDWSISTISYEIKLEITPGGDLSGKVEKRFSGEARLEAMKASRSIGAEKFLRSQLSSDQWRVSNAQSSFDSASNMVVRYELTIPNRAQFSDSLIYVSTYLNFRDEEKSIDA